MSYHRRIPLLEDFLQEARKGASPKRDANGNPILTPAEWNAMSEDEQEKLRGTITAKVTGPEGEFYVDRGLAPFLQRILDAGFSTGQSDSGMTYDHPNDRHVRTGELLYPTVGGCRGYLTFWKPEATTVKEAGMGVNTAEQISAVRDAARDAGLIVEDTQTFFQPSLMVTFPETNDGTARADILKEANGMCDADHPGLYKEDFMKWIDLRNDVYEPKVLKRHGGVHYYSDSEVRAIWEKFVKSLEASARKSP